MLRFNAFFSGSDSRASVRRPSGIAQRSQAFLCLLVGLTFAMLAAGALAQSPVPSLSKRGGIDVDGNGRSVLLVRTPTVGANAPSVPQMQVGRLTGTGSSSRFQFSSQTDPGASFRVVGVTDYDGNGRSDLVVQNMSQGEFGDVHLWTDFFSTAGRVLRQVKQVWDVQVVGDMDGDGRGDLVWRYVVRESPDTGVSYIWFSNGNNAPIVRKRGGAPLEWTLLGAADLNGDNAADMVYISPAGQIRVLMATAARTCANMVAGNIPQGFTTLAFADFTGGKRGDVLVRNNTNGQVSLLSLNANGLTLPAFTGDPDDRNANCTSSSLTVANQAINLPNSDPAWQYYASGDYDGNGSFDIVWLKPDGTLALWLMGSDGNVLHNIANAGSTNVGFASTNGTTYWSPVGGSNTVNPPPPPPPTNQAPTVSLTAPTNNTSVGVNTAVNITSNAADTDGTIARVEFFASLNGTNTKIGEDTTSPYTFRWTPTTAGTYSLTARATDNANASTMSAPISVTVTTTTPPPPPTNQLPNVGLTAPASGSSTTTGSSVTITATASDADGSVGLVEFFATLNGTTTKLGEDANSPYSLNWVPTAEGSYTLTARATDNVGATRTSASVMLTVTQGTPPPPGTAYLPWSQASTWGGTLPRAGDAVTIPAGRRVLLDVSPPNLKSLLIEGELAFDLNQDLNLTADWIIVSGTSAKLNIGSETQPYTRRATITLTGTNPAENIMGMGTKVLGVMGGTLELFGQAKKNWTRLATTAVRGANQLILADGIDGWQFGDEIAIAPSDFEALEAEKRTIVAINSRTITLDRALDFDHWGTAPQSYGNKLLDMRAEVGNLSRNIVIRSAQNEERVLPGFDPQSRGPDGTQNGAGKRLEMGRFGGHLMFMAGSKIQLQNIEVTGMGQQGVLGRYPVHWHLNQDTSTGSFIRNSSIHNTFQRGLVIHQSNGVRAEGNVIFNTPGHAVFLEDGVERNNVLTDNLVMRVTYVLRKHRLSLKDDENANRAERQSGFWITNPQNTIRGNVVAGVENGWGYIFADVRSDKIPVVDRTVATFATNSYMLEFKDNIAHSVNFRPGPVDGGVGVFNLGYGPEEAGSCFRFDQRGVVSTHSATVSGITAYKCRNAALWSTNFKPIRGSMIADSRAAIINNQGEPEVTYLANSVVVARTVNNPASRISLEFGPFPGPTLFEFLEAGPVQFDNVLAAGVFADNDNSTPALSASAPSTNAGFTLSIRGPAYLTANSSTTVTIVVDRSGGYNGPITVRVEIPKRPNLSADNPYFFVTSDPLTIAAGATTGTLTLRNGAHPLSGNGQIMIVAEGGATLVNALPLFTATSAISYLDAANGNNVARLFADTASPRNPALSAMEFNRAGMAAVDGDLSTYAHASGTPLAWWQIDLERLYKLREIRLRSSASASFGNVWVLVSDFPAFTEGMTLAEALALPDWFVRRYQVGGVIGNPTTVALPPGSSGRFVRVWASGAGELKIPEIEIISD
jgi:hypothetical protein